MCRESPEGYDSFREYVRWKLWRVDALLMVSVLIGGVLVGVGAYAPRLRYHALTRFLFHGATALFMPIISYVVSATNDQSSISFTFNDKLTITADCIMPLHAFDVLKLTLLVLIVGVTITPVVAADARELGRNIAPPVVLLVQAIWTCYLVIYTMGTALGEEQEFRLWYLRALPWYGPPLLCARYCVCQTGYHVLCLLQGPKIICFSTEPSSNCWIYIMATLIMILHLLFRRHL